MPPAPAPLATFWRWFIDHEASLFAFEADQDRVFDLLADAMQAVDPSLTFEFGPVIDGRREFVISADGNLRAFPSVVALADAAPELPRWIVVRFRPRRDPGDLRIGKTIVRAAEVAVVPEVDEGKIGVQLFVPGYQPTPNSVFEQVAFLLLDQVLGEFDVETKIGYVEVGRRPSTLPAGAVPLTDLPAIVDRLAVT